MKCKACDYEYELMFGCKSPPEFIKIYGTFLIEKTDCEGYGRKGEVSLYACPKCHTVVLVD